MIGKSRHYSDESMERIKNTKAAIAQLFEQRKYSVEEVMTITLNIQREALISLFKMMPTQKSETVQNIHKAIDEIIILAEKESKEEIE